MKLNASSKILSLLKRKYSHAHCELDFENPLQLLVGTILSAQCTDKRVNIVTNALFKKYKTATDYLKVPVEELENDIRSTGFYRNKTKSIQGACRILVEKHGGKIPNDFDELLQLPGIGRKSANVILGHTCGRPGVIVDTHVTRVSQRLGFTKQKDPVKIEYDLQKLIPQKEWTFVSDVLVFHGRYCCYARKPNCPECPVLKLCPFEPKPRPT